MSSRLAAYEAALAVASETDRDQVLRRIVALAREIVPCKYAALGVADDHGTLQQFITCGMSDEEIAAIGDYPVGKGLLGVLIHDGEPLIVDDIQRDPRSVGFPAHHPPMRKLLGAPIKLADRTLGNIYLTEPDSGRFTDDDLQTLEILAAHAANAIERADLYRQLEQTATRATSQRDQLTTIMNTLPSGVLIINQATGMIEDANRRARFLLSGDESLMVRAMIPGETFTLVRDDGVPLNLFRTSDAAALPVHSVQGAIQRADGARTPVLIQAARLPEAEDHPAPRVVVVLQDISRMKDAEQLKDDFLALISHEFRTPLTAIHGGAHLLKNQGEQLDAETRTELLGDIVSESNRLDQMLVNMLSLAAAMAGRVTIRTEPVMLAPLIRRVADETRRRVRTIQMVIEVPRDLPPVECDPEALEQVLRNLYENALKYGPSDGIIRTTAEVEADWVTVSVIDQGVGIGPEHVTHVFERFRRPGADPTIRGMGLGLYLSRLLVEAQGGTIRADSAGPGTGATFSISLPVVADWDVPEQREKRGEQA